MLTVLALLLALMPQAPATPPAQEPYRAIHISEPDVQEAVKVALTKTKGTLITAERHSISANNLRLCLSMDRSSTREFARVVLSRDAKKRWTVTTWSWGSCGR